MDIHKFMAAALMVQDNAAATMGTEPIAELKLICSVGSSFSARVSLIFKASARLRAGFVYSLQIRHLVPRVPHMYMVWSGA